MSHFKSDHQIIRDYVTAMDHLQYTNLPDGVVAITIMHSNLTAKHVDIRLDLHNTIAQVKDKFRTHIGTPVEFQRLTLMRNGARVCEMPDDHRMLGYYSVQSGDEIFIHDSDPFSLSRNGGLTDVSLVEKYKISEEAYEKRKGTMREYIREQRNKDPNFRLKPASTPGEPRELPGPDSVQGITVGARCEVSPGGRRGVVKFVGEMAKRGFWVGVQFDEPVGHNDGSVKGEVYFSCPMGYGAFVRGDKVQVGDFPERDPFADEDGEEHAHHHDEKEEDSCDAVQQADEDEI